MKVKVDDLASTIMEGLKEYADFASEEMKQAVRKSGNLVRNEIKQTAPVGESGKYHQSWRVKAERETSQSLQLVVHSKTRYQLAHLLEKGHAKRNGGRVPGQPHIAPAEEKGIATLEKQIKEGLKGG